MQLNLPADFLNRFDPSEKQIVYDYVFQKISVSLVTQNALLYKANYEKKPRKNLCSLITLLDELPGGKM